jgi:hypothetical protein
MPTKFRRLPARVLDKVLFCVAQYDAGRPKSATTSAGIGAIETGTPMRCPTGVFHQKSKQYQNHRRGIEVNAEECGASLPGIWPKRFQNGEIQIQPHPKGRLMTLFRKGWNRHVGWTDMGWGKREETLRGKKKRPTSLVAQRR